MINRASQPAVPPTYLLGACHDAMYACFAFVCASFFGTIAHSSTILRRILQGANIILYVILEQSTQRLQVTSTKLSLGWVCGMVCITCHLFAPFSPSSYFPFCTPDTCKLALSVYTTLKGKTVHIMSPNKSSVTYLRHHNLCRIVSRDHVRNNAHPHILCSLASFYREDRRPPRLYIRNIRKV